MNSIVTSYASGMGTSTDLGITFLLESIGVETDKRLTVPKKLIDKFEIYAYGMENCPGTETVYSFGGGVLAKEVL